ncbi:zinc finger domain-containing protein [Streptomyces mirabilis]|uniref:zinc finger domain-containing protein n=1 Tax=Streptomyces mirabilis TaxID=68239 RepID=UPI003F4BE3F3
MRVRAVGLWECPDCDAPAGSACRRGGKSAAKHHTPRFVFVPALREELEVPVPADRHPGRAWKQGPALAVMPAPRTERPVRIGYSRTSTARLELASRLEALHRAECPSRPPSTADAITTHGHYAGQVTEGKNI